MWKKYGSVLFRFRDFVSVLSFPQLLSLESRHLGMKAIHFTKENTPKLKHLSIDLVQNVIRYFLTDLPDLETCAFQFLSIDDPRGLGKSLSRSPKLKSISCYKFWGIGDKKSETHVIVLPNCEHLKFHRSEDLTYMKIWAPKLQDLNFQACYDIKEVTILDSIPQGYEAKDKEYSFSGKPSEYRVNFLNTTIPKGNATTHSRCTEVIENMEEMTF